MLRHRWLAPVFLTLISIGVLPQTRAQDMAPPGFDGSQMPSYGLDPSMFHSGQAPMYYQPWPAISPYMGHGQQLSNKDGLWQYEDLSKLNGKRRFRLRTEYVHVTGERPAKTVGHADAPTYKAQIVETLRAAGGGGGGGGGADLDDYADLLDGSSGFGSFNLYDPVHVSDFERPELDGIRLTLEVLNPDGTSFDLWGQWAQDNSTEFNARDDVDPSRGTNPDAVLFLLDPENTSFRLNLAQNPPGTPDALEVFQNELLNLRGIPLNDGSFVDIGNIRAGGANAVYDLDFRLATHMNTYSTGLRWKGFKFAERGNLVIRPTGGIRFDAFLEDFRFFGRDSGVLYDGQDIDEPPLPDVKIHSIPNGFDDNQDGIIDNAGGIEDNIGGQGGGGGGNQNTEFSFYFINDFDDTYPITSILENQVNSYLAGPEIGLDYVIGEGRMFKVGGSTTVALLANHQRIRLSGDNIFVTTRQGDLIPRTADNARPNTFSSSIEHTSVSPLLEQHVYVDGQIFGRVPILKRSSIMRKANLRVGYTFTAVGALTRAPDSIVWQGNPAEGIFPVIKTERSTWYAHSWDIGVSWGW
jgi:hypothetical protein